MSDISSAPPLPCPTDVIPHRAPFLFIDDIISCTNDEVAGRYRFSAEMPFFAGHFPGRPLVPGVLLLEGAAQTLAYWALRERPKNWVLLTGVERAKWTAAVEPDQEVVYMVRVTRAKMNLVIAEVDVTRGGERVLSARIKGYLQTRVQEV